MIAPLLAALLPIAWHGPATHGAMRSLPRARPASMLSEELRVKLVQKGFAVPGMEEAGREATAKATERLCTQAAPCPLDASELLFSTLQAAGVALLFLLFFSQLAASASDEGMLDLEAQAERSRARRHARSRTSAMVSCAN